MISLSKRVWGQVLGASVVQAFSFEPILGKVLKTWTVWQPLHLFSMGEKLFLCSALKRLSSGCFFHHCNWSTFHGSEDCS